jgi:hypothetical protein
MEKCWLEKIVIKNANGKKIKLSLMCGELPSIIDRRYPMSIRDLEQD